MFVINIKMQSMAGLKYPGTDPQLRLLRYIFVCMPELPEDANSTILASAGRYFVGWLSLT